MKKQKIAVLLGSFFLLTSILLPAVVSAETQSSSVVVSGLTDVFFEGYSGANNPNAVSFTGVTASSSLQETTLAITADAWTDDQFIGVIDLEAGNTWTLSIDAPATFSGAGGGTLTPATFEGETSMNEWAAAPDITDSSANAFQMVLETAGTDVQDMAYWVDGAGSYSWTLADVTAPLNNPDSFDWATGSFNTDISGATSILVNSSDDSEMGIFGTGINFNISITAGTEADTYTGVLTYTLA